MIFLDGLNLPRALHEEFEKKGITTHAALEREFHGRAADLAQLCATHGVNAMELRSTASSMVNGAHVTFPWAKLVKEERRNERKLLEELEFGFGALDGEPPGAAPFGLPERQTVEIVSPPEGNPAKRSVYACAVKVPAPPVDLIKAGIIGKIEALPTDDLEQAEAAAKALAEAHKAEDKEVRDAIAEHNTEATSLDVAMNAGKDFEESVVETGKAIVDTLTETVGKIDTIPEKKDADQKPASGKGRRAKPSPAPAPDSSKPEE